MFLFANAENDTKFFYHNKQTEIIVLRRCKGNEKILMYSSLSRIIFANRFPWKRNSFLSFTATQVYAKKFWLCVFVAVALFAMTFTRTMQRIQTFSLPIYSLFAHYNKLCVKFVRFRVLLLNAKKDWDALFKNDRLLVIYLLRFCFSVPIFVVLKYSSIWQLISIIWL